MGKAQKTLFLCDYLRLESLRREIYEGLQVIENRNNANDFILYGKGGEFASNRLEDQEIVMLSLHLLQVSMVYVSTLIFQQVLAEPEWADRLTPVDLRALSPLKWQHIHPFALNISDGLPLAVLDPAPKVRKIRIILAVLFRGEVIRKRCLREWRPTYINISQIAD